MSKKELKEKRQRTQMRNIIIGVAAVLISIAAIIIGIASANEGTEDGHNHDHSNGAEQNATVNLRVALSSGEGDAQYECVQLFKEEVEKKSGGTIQVTIYGNQQLGSDGALVNGLQRGDSQTDIVVTGVENFVEIDPRMDISMIPFIFSGYEDAWAFVEGNTQEKVENDLIEHNIRVLAHYSDGFDYMTTGKTAIANAIDLKGKNFAVDNNSPMRAFLPLFGANALTVAEADLSQTVASGRADGYVGSLDTILSTGLYQYQKTVAVTYHRYYAQAFAISESKWNLLTNEQQKIVKAAAESSAASNRSLVQQNEMKTLREFENANLRVSYPSIVSFAREAAARVRSYESKYGDLIYDVIHNMER